MSLLSVGTVAFDKLTTPFGKTDKILGGAATYIGLASSLLNVKNAIVSVVGEDFPKDYLDILETRGTDISGIEVVKGGKTFFWEGVYHTDMNTRDTITTDLNVLENFEPKIPFGWEKPEVLMLGNLHPAVQLSVLDQLQERPKITILDTMNFWIDQTPDLLNEMIDKTDVLTINDEEARMLTGEYSLKKAAILLLQRNIKYLIIKKGEHGALLFAEDKVFFAPALPLEEVFDPTGAGDTFAGGFAAYLAKTKDYSFDNLKRAIIYGSALASFVVEKFGTEKLLNLTEQDISERLAEFESLTSYDMKLD